MDDKRVLKPYIIGVAGPSGAGKTMLAAHLAQVLPAAMFSIDWYYRELTHMTYDERSRFNFDEPAALEEPLMVRQLDALRHGEPVARPVYDFSTHNRRPESELLEPQQFIIVEGLFALYWESIRDLLDTAVYVDTEDNLCLERRKERDVRERGRTVESVLKQYGATVRPGAQKYVWPTVRFADVVVCGTDPIEKSGAAVLSHIRSKRPELLEPSAASIRS